MLCLGKLRFPFNSFKPKRFEMPLRRLIKPVLLMLPVIWGAFALAWSHYSLAQSPLSPNSHQNNTSDIPSENAIPVKAFNAPAHPGQNAVQATPPQDETVRFLMGDVLVEEGSIQRYLSRKPSR